jgi:carbamate kinase
VSPYDASFYRPNKEIGKILTEEEALLEEDLGNQVKKLRDGQFRRVVPSPVPETVVELDAIKALIDHGAIVIAAGGGGIPVLPEGLDLRGSAAIIEKDLTASLLARNLGADVLLLSTSVPHVSVSYRQETQRDISRMSPEQAEALIEAGEFSEGTMRPKVEAAADFARSGKGRRGIITTLSLAGMALAGEAGTTIQIQEA